MKIVFSSYFRQKWTDLRQTKTKMIIEAECILPTQVCLHVFIGSVYRRNNFDVFVVSFYRPRTMIIYE